MKYIILILLTFFLLACNYQPEDFNHEIYKAFGTNITIRSLATKGNFLISDEHNKKYLIRLADRYTGVKRPPPIYSIENIQE